MSRFVFALVVVCFVLAPVRAADPKPLWETDTTTDEKRRHTAEWVGYSPDGKTIVARIRVGPTMPLAADEKGRLVAWDVETKKERFALDIGAWTFTGGQAREHAFTKAGTLLVPGSDALEVRLSDGMKVTKKGRGGYAESVWMKPGAPQALWLFGEADFGDYRLAFGKMPGFGAEPKKGDLDDKWPEAKLPKLDDRELFTAVFAASPDLSRFVVARRAKDGKNVLTLYTVAIGDELKLTEVATVPNGHVGHTCRMQFSPDGKTFVTGSGDSVVGLWDVAKADKDWKPHTTITVSNASIGSFAFYPDGRTLAATTWDNKRTNLVFIDLAARKTVASYRFDTALMSVAISPDGKTLVTGDFLGRIKTWDAETIRNP